MGGKQQKKSSHEKLSLKTRFAVANHDVRLQMSIYSLAMCIGLMVFFAFL